MNWALLSPRLFPWSPEPLAKARPSREVPMSILGPLGSPEALDIAARERIAERERVAAPLRLAAEARREREDWRPRKGVLPRVIRVVIVACLRQRPAAAVGGMARWIARGGLGVIGRAQRGEAALPMATSVSEIPSEVPHR